MSRPKKKRTDRPAEWFIQRAGQRDANHGDVRDGLRKAGYEVVDTAALPKRADLLVHIGSDRWLWLEVKTATGQLTADEVKFRDKCTRLGARWALVRSLTEALDALVRAGGKGLAPSSGVVAGQHVKRGTVSPAGEWRGVATYTVRPATDRGRRAGETIDQHIRRLAVSGTVRR